MMTARGFQEAVARCVSILVFYQNSERTPHSPGLMRSEIRAVAAMIAATARPGEDPDRVDLPVRAELVARYGPELGPRLFENFLEAYGSRRRGPGIPARPPLVVPPKVELP